MPTGPDAPAGNPGRSHGRRALRDRQGGGADDRSGVVVGAAARCRAEQRGAADRDQRRCPGAAPSGGHGDGGGAPGGRDAPELCDPTAILGTLSGYDRPVQVQFHGWVNRMWQKRGLIARLLWPLSLLYALGRALVVGAYRVGLPVIVIGNLYTGGSGKTPLVIELVSLLKRRGWHPGVVSRGYGGTAHQARLVTEGSEASECGDEPLLIASTTGVPVGIGRDRVAAAKLLLSMHPTCDVLASDDGLQHRRLARGFEIAVIHGRGLGPGWRPPARPARASTL